MRFWVVLCFLGLSPGLSAFAWPWSGSGSGTSEESGPSVVFSSDLYYTDSPEKNEKMAAVFQKLLTDMRRQDPNCAKFENCMDGEAQDWERQTILNSKSFGLSAGQAFLKNNACIESLRTGILDPKVASGFLDVCKDAYTGSAKLYVDEAKNERGYGALADEIKWSHQCSLQVVLRERNGLIQTFLSMGSTLKMPPGISGIRYKDLPSHEINLGISVNKIEDLKGSAACKLNNYSAALSEKIKSDKAADADKKTLSECRGRLVGLQAQRDRYSEFFGSLQNEWMKDFTETLVERAGASIDKTAPITLSDCNQEVALLTQDLKVDGAVFNKVEAKYPRDLAWPADLGKASDPAAPSEPAK